MIFYRWLFILMSFVFSYYSHAKNLTIMFSSPVNTTLRICRHQNNSLAASIDVKKDSWDNIFTFDDSSFNDYFFCSHFNDFNATISGTNQGDDTICCMLDNGSDIRYCVYNNSFSDYPACK